MSRTHTILSTLKTLITQVIIGLIYIYKVCISPLLGRRCRYYPTCSTYTRDAVLMYGPLHGLWRGVIRILKCNRFFPGGYDPVRKEEGNY